MQTLTAAQITVTTTVRVLPLGLTHPIAMLPFGGQYREEPLRFKKALSVFMIKEDLVWNGF